MPHPDAPAKQKKLMEAAAHTEGGYGGVSQAGAKKWLGNDSTRHDAAHLKNARKDAMDKHRSDNKWSK